MAEADQLIPPLKICLGHAELFQLEHLRAFVEDAQHHALAEEHRNHRHPQVVFPAFVPKADPPIL